MMDRDMSLEINDLTKIVSKKCYEMVAFAVWAGYTITNIRATPLRKHAKLGVFRFLGVC